MDQQSGCPSLPGYSGFLFGRFSRSIKTATGRAASHVAREMRDQRLDVSHSSRLFSEYFVPFKSSLVSKRNLVELGYDSNTTER